MILLFIYIAVTERRCKTVYREGSPLVACGVDVDDEGGRSWLQGELDLFPSPGTNSLGILSRCILLPKETRRVLFGLSRTASGDVR